MIKKCTKSLPITLATLSFLFLSQIQVHAQGSQQKALPGILILLLSEENPAPPPQPNIAFVTSVAYNGNLGGLAGADQRCQALATAAGLPQNTYKAWLSTSSENAIDRLGNARGWVRVDEKPFADTKADIVAGKIFYPLRVDENGNYDNTVGGSFVWTGTSSSGTVYVNPGPLTCNDWISSDGVSGEVGYDDGVSSAYTQSGSTSCNIGYRLYCFGVDHDVPVTVKPVAGRTAFITKYPWIPSGGPAAADTACMNEATAAHLTGNFKALLATSTASAKSRFEPIDGSSLPWVRPDGVAIAPTAAALFEPVLDFLDTAIAQSADGSQYFGNYGVWTGASDPTTAGTAGTTCNNWTSSSAEASTIGSSGFTYLGKFFGRYSFGVYCDDTEKYLYCLQE